MITDPARWICGVRNTQLQEILDLRLELCQTSTKLKFKSEKINLDLILGFFILVKIRLTHKLSLTLFT